MLFDIFSQQITPCGKKNNNYKAGNQLLLLRFYFLHYESHPSLRVLVSTKNLPISASFAIFAVWFWVKLADKPPLNNSSLPIFDILSNSCLMIFYEISLKDFYGWKQYYC